MYILHNVYKSGHTANNEEWRRFFGQLLTEGALSRYLLCAFQFNFRLPRNMTTDTACPQWPDRCCLCLTKKYGVVVTGKVSMLFDFAFIIICFYTVYEPELWNSGKPKLFNMLYYVTFL